MNKRTVFLRAILIFAALSVFAYAGYYLYQKQTVQLSYHSFQVENPETSVYIPDVDRFIHKEGALENLAQENLPKNLLSALDTLKRHMDFSFNRTINSTVYLSYSSKNYNVTLKTGVTVASIVDIINDEFNTDASYTNGKFQINGVELFAQYFGNYLCFSTSEFSPIQTDKKLDQGNADYILYHGNIDAFTRHILSKNHHFKISQESKIKLIGRPVSTLSHIAVAPSDFTEILFYGSSRMAEDVGLFFPESKSEDFVWLDNALMQVKKDSFELLIARQGSSRDLDLILQEQTVDANADTTGLEYFNIGKFKILSFESRFSWMNSLGNLTTEPRFYTEYQDFNILANSIPAMRWYLGQVQLGNLFESNQSNLKFYQDCLPEQVHKLQLLKTDSSLSCSSEICDQKGITLITTVSSSNSTSNSKNTELIYDFSIPMTPSRIQIVNSNNEPNVLVNNLNEVAFFAVSGKQKWKLNLSSNLVEKPQIVDFDNDAIPEFVMFQKNQVDVIDLFGKSLPGFPIQLSGDSKTGLAVNYDNLFNYRIIVHQGDQVKIYSESGKLVEGWMFEGMTGKLSGKIYHVLAEGKDIITFKDENNQQYVLNRKGESRVSDQINFRLANETDFVVGGMSNSLRKYGYKNGFIYTYYLLDGEKDSLKVDQQINPNKIYWEFNGGKPLMIAEENGRLLIVDQFGYVKSEVLKPSGQNNFVGLVGEQDFGFVFADNIQNSIYLLNNFGKMLLPVAVKGSSVSTISGELLYTFSGTNIKAYKIIK